MRNYQCQTCGEGILLEPAEVEEHGAYCTEHMFSEQFPALDRLADQVSDKEEQRGNPRQETNRAAETETPIERNSVMSDSTTTHTRMTEARTGYIETQAPERDEFPMGEVLTDGVRHPEHIFATASWSYEGAKGAWDDTVRLDEYAEDETHGAHLHLSAKAGDSLPFGARLWMMDAHGDDISIRFASLEDAEEFGHWIARESQRLATISKEVEM